MLFKLGCSCSVDNANLYKYVSYNCEMYTEGEVSVAETENPDQDPRTQIARTIIYSCNVFCTVMVGARARTAALVMTYFAHEYSTACHFEFSKFTSFFFQILNCGHGSFNRTTGRGKYNFFNL